MTTSIPLLFYGSAELPDSSATFLLIYFFNLRTQRSVRAQITRCWWTGHPVQPRNKSSHGLLRRY